MVEENGDGIASCPGSQDRLQSPFQALVATATFEYLAKLSCFGDGEYVPIMSTI